jgi:aconitate hydratase 2/2-methylisocitrate dehydratase
MVQFLFLGEFFQARVADNATVVSTSTRNFPNRLGKGAVRSTPNGLGTGHGMVGRLVAVVLR